MKTHIKTLLFTSLWVASVSVQAIPTLQVGAPGGVGEGTYANYQASTTNPKESDTAITGGNTLYVAGAYQNGPKQELLIGGQYTNGTVSGDDWSALGFNAAFNGAGAVLMATVPNGTLGGAGNSITVNGSNAIFSTSTFESGFVMPNPPSNHDPVKNKDYLFFDIGDFAKTGSVPNFFDESGSAVGEVKSLALAISGFLWVHFDVIALVTTEDTSTGGGGGGGGGGGPKPKTQLVSNLSTDLAGNPGSHDVTWKNPGDKPPEGNAPEPSALWLLGLGLLGCASFARKAEKSVS